MSEKEKKIKKDPGRFKPAPQPKEIVEFIEVGCEKIGDKVNGIIRRACEAKKFTIDSGRPCTAGGGTAAPVDLVVVIDTSGSMSDEAEALSNAAANAISAAQKSCPSDLKVKWFGIEGTWPNTNFTQSYRNYLVAIPGVNDSDLTGTPGDQEDGAAAIADISTHFDWRTGAARAIFYLGDEALEGGNPQNAADTNAANCAIDAAKLRGVKVFTYFGTPLGALNPVTKAEYKRVATETNGAAFAAPVANVGGFETVLEKIICHSQGGCQPVKIPEILPCFKLKWGDGPNDQMETDDVEVLCITACNPYSNVTLKNLEIVVSVISKATGDPVPNLPDGTPSVFIKPSHMICFGDLPPCDPKNPNELTCVSREVVLVTRGAEATDYVFKIGYCFIAEFAFRGIDNFKFELVAS